MKKYFAASLMLVFAMVLSACSSNETTTFVPVEPVRTPQKTTVMVYLEGSDLERSTRFGTEKIKGMLNAQYSDYLNVVIQTGGGDINYNNTPMGEDLAYYPVKDWMKVQRYHVTNQKLTLLEDLGTSCLPVDHAPAGCTEMGSPDVLQDFIEKSITKFPADRYILVLTDHGGGSIGGYGGNFVKNMTINDIKKAIDTATSNKNIKFEIVSFDACLMGNIEFAYNLRSSAKYLVAYEEMGWSTSWDYTTVLTTIAQNPTITGEEIGKAISSSYATAQKELSMLTVSVIDLTKTEAIVNAIEAVAKISLDAFRADKPAGWVRFFNARNNSDEYGTTTGENYFFNQIDIISFANALEYYGNNNYRLHTENLKNAVKNAVVHSVSYSMHPDSTGLSIWLPFHFNGSIDGQIRYFEMYERMYNGTDLAKFSNTYITLLEELLQYAKITPSEFTVGTPTPDANKLSLDITSNFGVDDTILLIDKSQTEGIIEPVFSSIAEVATSGGNAFTAKADFNHKVLKLNGHAIFAYPHNVITDKHGSKFNISIPMYYKKAGSQGAPIKVYTLAGFDFATGESDIDSLLIPGNSRGGDGFQAEPGDILIIPEVKIDVQSKMMTIAASSIEITLTEGENGGLQLTHEEDITMNQYAFWLKNLKGDIQVVYFNEAIRAMTSSLTDEKDNTAKAEALAEALHKPFWTK